MAMDIARKTGASDIGRLIGDSVGAGKQLSSLNNVLSDMFVEPKLETATVPSSKICLQKAALITFQTWAYREPGLCGVLMGMRPKPGKPQIACAKVIVASSVEDILGDPRVKQLGLFPVGVALCGDAGEDDRLSLGQRWCTELLGEAHDVDTTVCVFAPRHCGNK